MKFLIVIIILIGGLLLVYINVKIKFKIIFTVHNATIFLNIIFLKKDFNIINRKFDYIVIFKKFLYRVGNAEAPHINYSKYLKGYKYFKKIFILNNFSFYEDCFNNNPSFAVEFNLVNKFKKKLLLND
jgi:hypothetical protein